MLFINCLSILSEIRPEHPQQGSLTVAMKLLGPGGPLPPHTSAPQVNQQHKQF